MCSHIFVSYQGLQPLRQHHALWRCSTCGRQSSMPLDCCAQPAYDMAQPTPLIVSSVRWFRQRLSGLQRRIRSWRLRPLQPDVGIEAALNDLPPVLADEMLEPVSTLDADLEAVAAYDDLTEDMPDRVHELQVS